MGIFMISLITWCVAVFAEMALFPALPWFRPSMLFLFSCIVCLRWRGFETHFFAVLLGMTADSFSTAPFGIFGLSFLLISFFTRWYAIRIFQGSYVVVAVITGGLTLANQLMAYLIMDLIYGSGGMTFGWLWRIVISGVFPTVLLSIPCFKMFVYLENRYRIRLAERKF